MDLFETPKIEFIEINDCDILSPINYCSHITLCSADFKYVFTTDIAAFFHQILLDERDLDVFRYLWFTDDEMREDCVKRFLSHIFGSALSSCITSVSIFL